MDTYNALSMDLVLPVGAYYSSAMDGGLKLRVSNGGEDFFPIGKSRSIPTQPGEIVYSDNFDVLTRQFLWQQSEKAKITDSTTQIVFVCELLSVMGKDFIEMTLRTIEHRLHKLLGIRKISELYVHGNN